VLHLPRRDSFCRFHGKSGFSHGKSGKSYEDIRADVEKAEEYWQLANEARGPVLKAEYDKMARKIMDQIRPALS
jgi:hypothetical protein